MATFLSLLILPWVWSSLDQPLGWGYFCWWVYWIREVEASFKGSPCNPCWSSGKQQDCLRLCDSSLIPAALQLLLLSEPHHLWVGPLRHLPPLPAPAFSSPRPPFILNEPLKFLSPSLCFLKSHSSCLQDMRQCFWKAACNSAPTLLL